jgi:molybdenum cofactor sulfurtransferase
MNLYLDNASSVLYSNILLADLVLDTNMYSNPHSFSNESQNSTNKINEIRNKVLLSVNASSDDYECIFTSGATDSLKKVAEYFNWTDYSDFIYTIDNHTSVIGMREYALLNGSNIKVIDFSNNNIVELNSWFRPENKGKNDSNSNSNSKPTNLFAMPYESNFSGKKYSPDNINKIREKYGENTIFLSDTAKYISTNYLDLSDKIIDIAVISFYKMFGFPTGVGALILKKSVIKHMQRKHYFGGGTVSVSSGESDYAISRHLLHEWFEDGSPNYLGIIALDRNLDKVINKTIDYGMISKITYDFYSLITKMKYSNGQPIFELYDVPKKNNITQTEFKEQHGSIITFNLLKTDGSYIGYKEVENVCALNGIAIRTGCLCNVGACSKNLNISLSELQRNFEMGHTCGDDKDIINGKPTGAIRVSFGLNNNYSDVDRFLDFINKNFINYYTENLITTNPDPDYNPNRNETVINNIIIFPIKSCGMFETQKWIIGPRGLLYDREWSLIDSENKVMRQKRYENLAKLKCSIDLSTNLLTVVYDNKKLDIDIFSTPEESVTQKQCVYTVEGYQYSDGINAWFTTCLGVSCKLVRSSGSRKIKDTDNELSFSNEGQLLLVNNTSIEDVNKRGEFNYNYTRYRPNIVITAKEAYEEDSWESIENRDNSIQLKVFTKCRRCGMINISQDDNDNKDDRNMRDCEPLLTLSKYRREKTNIFFGVLLYIEAGYNRMISVGDKFIINKNKQ